MKVKIAAFVIIFIAVLLVVVEITFSLRDKNDADEFVTIETKDGREVHLGGDMIPDRNIFDVSVIDESITIVLINGVDSQHCWRILDLDLPSSSSTVIFKEYVGYEVATSSKELIIEPIQYGSFHISIDENNHSYSGDIVLFSDVHKEFILIYEGNEHIVHVNYPYKDYIESKQKAINRSPTFDYYPEYICIQEPVCQVASYIIDHFDSDYQRANFALSFVQNCIRYPPCSIDSNGRYLMSPDKYLTGENNYVFFPIETMHRGMGDCEDTAILCVALMSSMHIQAYLLEIPGHMLSLVGVQSVMVPDINPAYSVYRMEINGSIFSVCETSTDFSLPVGYAQNAPAFDDKYLNHYLIPENVIGLSSDIATNGK